MYEKRGAHVALVSATLRRMLGCDVRCTRFCAGTVREKPVAVIDRDGKLVEQRGSATGGLGRARRPRCTRPEPDTAARNSCKPLATSFAAGSRPVYIRKLIVRAEGPARRN